MWLRSCGSVGVDLCRDFESQATVLTSEGSTVFTLICLADRHRVGRFVSASTAAAVAAAHQASYGEAVEVVAPATYGFDSPYVDGLSASDAARWDSAGSEDDGYAAERMAFDVLLPDACVCDEDEDSSMCWPCELEYRSAEADGESDDRRFFCCPQCG